MGSGIQFPIPGSIVEYLEDNQIQTAMVLEESAGKLRLVLSNRRETRLGANRVLPWIGPQYAANLGREEAVKIIERHKTARQEKARAINALEVWEMAAGEINQAPASWFAELYENDPDMDGIAAYGHALLECKTHFRFTGQDFLIFDQETTEKRIQEKEQRKQREAFAGSGAAFIKFLWEIASKKRAFPENGDYSQFLPEAAIADKLEKMLFEHMINPDTHKDDSLWRQLAHGLPENPLIAVQLLQAWGKIPPHYNFWLDRADYVSGDQWWKNDGSEVEKLREIASVERLSELLPEYSLPFLSIDGKTTTDIDDAFYLEKSDSGWKVCLAFACPALSWPFGSHFDKHIARRATSIYLPEETLHMLPSSLGEDAFSLWAHKQKAAFCMELDLDETGGILQIKPYAARISAQANLHYDDVQYVLVDTADAGENPALAYRDILKSALALARLLEEKRISNGAVIMNRPEIGISLSGTGKETIVELDREPDYTEAKLLVSELMVLASASIAKWAAQNDIPLIHRTQKITIPKEYAGIWSNPEDISKIMRSLMPSLLEISPAPHAALGVSRYAPITSPLRRYADLLNEAQILHFLQTGKNRWEKNELESLLNAFSPHLESASQAQKFRPRYWKLLYFKQKGDKCWWPAVITEENENFVMVELPDQGLFVRGKRQLFDERATPGMKVMARIGKVNPLYNDIQILETMPAE